MTRPYAPEKSILFIRFSTFFKKDLTLGSLCYKIYLYIYVWVMLCEGYFRDCQGA